MADGHNGCQIDCTFVDVSVSSAYITHLKCAFIIVAPTFMSISDRKSKMFHFKHVVMLLSISGIIAIIL